MSYMREQEVLRQKPAKQGRGMECRNGSDIWDKVPKKSSWWRKHMCKDLAEVMGEAGWLFGKEHCREREQWVQAQSQERAQTAGGGAGSVWLHQREQKGERLERRSGQKEGGVAGSRHAGPKLSRWGHRLLLWMRWEATEGFWAVGWRDHQTYILGVW